MTASMPPQDAIKLYAEISERLASPILQNRLGKLFEKRQTLSQLLEWVHTRVKFNKGDIIRHNDPLEIVEYGQGMCREFSVLFTAICLANGYRARIILDLSDHAWTEVWSNELAKWVHVDPSEKRIDDPAMYERDWEKNLEEVYAFENGAITNVTKSYKAGDRTG